MHKGRMICERTLKPQHCSLRHVCVTTTVDLRIFMSRLNARFDWIGDILPRIRRESRKWSNFVERSFRHAHGYFSHGEFLTHVSQVPLTVNFRISDPNLVPVTCLLVPVTAVTENDWISGQLAKVRSWRVMVELGCCRL